MRSRRGHRGLEEQSHPLFDEWSTKNSGHVENFEVEAAIGIARPPFFRDPAKILSGNHGDVGAVALAASCQTLSITESSGFATMTRKHANRVTRVADIALELPEVEGGNE